MPNSIFQIIESTANPQAESITAPDRIPLTYASLLKQINSNVKFMNSNGIGRNDPVAIVLPDGPEMTVALL